MDYANYNNITSSNKYSQCSNINSGLCNKKPYISECNKDVIEISSNGNSSKSKNNKKLNAFISNIIAGGKQLLNSSNTGKITEKSFYKDEYGYRCQDSQPLKAFSTIATEDIITQGLSTPRYIGDTYLKGSMKQPLSTQDVHDCAFVSLYNNKTQTQAIYHVLVNSKAAEIKDTINAIMPEGFDSVSIISGDAEGTEKTTTSIYNAVKDLSKTADIKFSHYTSDSPALVSYDGEVYEISNPNNSPLFNVPTDEHLTSVMYLLNS